MLRRIDAPSQRPDDDEPPPRDPLTRTLRALYTPPGEGYWEGLEQKVMAAVRAGRQAPAQWWQMLATWTRPGLAAAAVVLAVVGTAALQARAARARVAYRAVIEEPGSVSIEPVDADLARAVDAATADSTTAAERRAARDAGYLVTGGLDRQRTVPLASDARPAAPAAVPVAEPSEEARRRARREATFRYVMPDE